ncbi:MAG: class I SAM-dependent methyltransferase [Bulleidia sp.]
MKTDYKNWMPKGMIAGTGCALAASLILLILISHPAARVIFGILSIILAILLAWMTALYRAFDYSGKRQMSRKIIEGISEYVSVPDGGTCLDVGCGSGALTIACAKKNPRAFITGLDRWGKEYASFSKTLCENNAAAEGVSNVRFVQGNALKLPFEDETFDALTSNYVYHNIPSRNRQAILMESLRVLKKGGTFAIHDIFSASRYGDMHAFAEKLTAIGYQDVHLIPTDEGMFMSHKEAVLMDLSGSAILTGKKN